MMIQQLPPKVIDLHGQTFGRLTVIEFCGIEKHRTVWRCACSCGAVVIVNPNNLKRGRTQSCGCLNSEKRRTNTLKHGKRYTPEYGTYCDARKRCNNPRGKCFPNYGGRGIEFRFQSFNEFYAALGPKPSPQHSLDRIDNDGNYEPGNVRWATPKEQANNRRKRRFYRANE